MKKILYTIGAMMLALCGSAQTMTQADDYVVTQSGGIYYARPRPSSGLPLISNADAYTVLQGAINALETAGCSSCGGGSIALTDSSYVLTNELSITGWASGGLLNGGGPSAQLVIKGRSATVKIAQGTSGKNAISIKNGASVVLRGLYFSIGASAKSAVLMDSTGTGTKMGCYGCLLDNISVSSASTSSPGMYLRDFYYSTFDHISIVSASSDALVLENASSSVNYGKSSFGLLSLSGSGAAGHAGLKIQANGNTSGSALCQLSFGNVAISGGYYGLCTGYAVSCHFDKISTSGNVYRPVYLGASGSASSGITVSSASLSSDSAVYTAIAVGPGCARNVFRGTVITGASASIVPIADSATAREPDSYSDMSFDGADYSPNIYIANFANTQISYKLSTGALHSYGPSAGAKMIAQAGHGLTVNMPINVSSSGIWYPADTTSYAIAVVSQVPDANHFEARPSGAFRAPSHGLPIGAPQYIGPAAGTLSPFPSSQPQQIEVPITADSIMVSISARPAAAFSPAQIPGLFAWYVADSVDTSGSNVTMLKDISGNGHNMATTLAGAFPQWHASGGANNRPYISFAPGQNIYAPAFTPVDTPYNILMVLRNDSLSDQSYLLSLDRGNSVQIIQAQIPAGKAVQMQGSSKYMFARNGYNTDWQSLNMVYGNVQSKMQVDNYNWADSKYLNHGNGQALLSMSALGFQPNYKMTGKFSVEEVIIYSNRVSAANSFFLNNYAINKYALPPKEMLVAFGQSVTEGSDATNFDSSSYVADIARDMNRDVVNNAFTSSVAVPRGTCTGFPGHNFIDQYPAALSQMANLSTATFLFDFGHNEVSCTDSTWAAQYAAIVNLFISAGVQKNHILIVTGPCYATGGPRPGVETTTYTWTKAVATATGATFVDIYACQFSSFNPAYIAPDGVHLTDRGMLAEAACIEPYIVP